VNDSSDTPPSLNFLQFTTKIIRLPQQPRMIEQSFSGHRPDYRNIHPRGAFLRTESVPVFPMDANCGEVSAPCRPDANAQKPEVIKHGFRLVLSPVHPKKLL
jgi:hypothetical protein